MFFADSSKSKGKHLYAVYRKYLTESSLHGLKYFNDPTARTLERVFWVVSLAVCWIAGGWWCYEV